MIQCNKNALSKTALGAEETLPWTYHRSALDGIRSLENTHEIVAIETSPRSVDLFEWHPRFPVCIMFGHEVDGLQPELQEAAHTHVRIPMLGRKHSLNVATAGGVVIFELLRKFHTLQRMGK